MNGLILKQLTTTFREVCRVATAGARERRFMGRPSEALCAQCGGQPAAAAAHQQRRQLLDGDPQRPRRRPQRDTLRVFRQCVLSACCEAGDSREQPRAARAWIPPHCHPRQGCAAQPRPEGPFDDGHGGWWEACRQWGVSGGRRRRGTERGVEVRRTAPLYEVIGSWQVGQQRGLA